MRRQTTKRSDGKRQVTYKGHPLYLYQGDTKAGDINGQGINAFGGGWFAVSPAGTQVSGQARSRARATVTSRHTEATQSV